MPQVRSPGYPNISLPAALERIRKVHAVEGMNELNRESFVQILGYSGLNGPSGKILSSLGKYGLLVKTGSGEVKISDLAMEIMFGEPDAKDAALGRAANSPSLFSEINEKWPERQPGDESLRGFLARKGFSTKALDRASSAYRETMSLVSDRSGGYNSSSESRGNEEGSPDMDQDRAQPGFSRNPPPPTIEAMRVSVTSAGLEIAAGLADQEGVDRLIRILEANKPLLPHKKQVEGQGDQGTLSGQEAEPENDEAAEIH